MSPRKKPKFSVSASSTKKPNTTLPMFMRGPLQEVQGIMPQPVPDRNRATNRAGAQRRSSRFSRCGNQLPSTREIERKSHARTDRRRRLMSGKKHNFVVIGLGMFGRTIATQLVSFGNHVLGIDSNEARVNDVIDELSEAVIADVRDEESLREAGVDQYDVAVIAIGDDLESNVLCTMNVKLLGVETIWAKAMNPTHHRILDRLGADRVIHPEEEIGQHVAQMLHNPLVRDYLSLGDGNYLVDLSIPESFEGKRLEELKLADHEDIRVVGIMRGSEYIAGQDDETLLEVDDKLLLLGQRDPLRDFSDSL